MEDFDPVIGSGRALRELVKPLIPSFSPIHAGTTSLCSDILTIVETADQVSPNLCTLAT